MKRYLLAPVRGLVAGGAGRDRTRRGDGDDPAAGAHRDLPHAGAGRALPTPSSAGAWPGRGVGSRSARATTRPRRRRSRGPTAGTSTTTSSTARRGCRRSSLKVEAYSKDSDLRARLAVARVDTVHRRPRRRVAVRPDRGRGGRRRRCHRPALVAGGGVGGRAGAGRAAGWRSGRRRCGCTPGGAGSCSAPSRSRGGTPPGSGPGSAGRCSTPGTARGWPAWAWVRLGILVFHLVATVIVLGRPLPVRGVADPPVLRPLPASGGRVDRRGLPAAVPAAARAARPRRDRALPGRPHPLREPGRRRPGAALVLGVQATRRPGGICCGRSPTRRSACSA